LIKTINYSSIEELGLMGFPKTCSGNCLRRRLLFLLRIGSLGLNSNSEMLGEIKGKCFFGLPLLLAEHTFWPPLQTLLSAMRS